MYEKNSQANNRSKIVSVRAVAENTEYASFEIQLMAANTKRI